MVAELIENPKAIQTVEHNIESIFWVLLWICILYMDTNLDVRQRSSLIKGTMSPSVYVNTGGNGKVDFLANKARLNLLETPTSQPIAVLLKLLHGSVGKRFQNSSPSSGIHLSTLSQRKGRTQSETRPSNNDDDDESWTQQSDDDNESWMQQSDDDDDIAAQHSDHDDKSGSQQRDDNNKSESATRQEDDVDKHADVLRCMRQVLRWKMWPKKCDPDSAKPQALAGSNDKTFALKSGSKRTRDMAEENGLLGPPTKRFAEA